MENARLFLAVQLSDALKTGLAKVTAELSERLPGIRWVNAAAMHITVKFFGSIPLDELPRIDRVVREAAAGHGTFPLVAGRLGVFPSTRRPYVIWADVMDGVQQLTQLAGEVLTGLEQEGFEPDERAFVPHITLGRFRKGRRLSGHALQDALAEYQERELGSSPVTRITLLSSDLTPEGAIYTEVRSWPLSSTAEGGAR